MSRRTSRRDLSTATATAICPAATALSTVRTRNFEVSASSMEIAQRVAEQAEREREKAALRWFGDTLPDWRTRCPVQVKLTGGNAGGLTTFTFKGSTVASQQVHVEGRIENVLTQSLPHEVTHMVMAERLGQVPRWADEGIALMAESQQTYVDYMSQALGAQQRGRLLPLRSVLERAEYPEAELHQFYGQGFALCRFLVQWRGRAHLVDFIREGQRSGWDAAIQQHYGLRSCEELDRVWRRWLSNS